MPLPAKSSHLIELTAAEVEMPDYVWAGRYQSPEPMDRSAVEAFLTQYREFLEGDARHAIWVASTAGEGTLVYDRHNIIYAYGPIECFEDVLTARGIRRGEVKLPSPHSHHYHREHDADEERLLAAMEWIQTPLRDGDDE
jgi:hypothetical protein